MARALGILLILFLCSCGSGDTVAFRFVSNFSVDPGSASVGSQATVVVVFESSSKSAIEEPGESEATDLAVLLPRGVALVNDSSELAGSATGFRRRSPNSINSCNDGSRAILYKFDGAELSNSGDNRLRLQVSPTEARGTVTISAEADTVIFNPCFITAQNSGTLTIEP